MGCTSFIQYRILLLSISLVLACPPTAIHQKGAEVVEMAGYREDGMVGMMVREEVDCIIIGRMIVVENIHCLKTACDQNIPYMGEGGLASYKKQELTSYESSHPTTSLPPMPLSFALWAATLCLPKSSIDLSYWQDALI
jgi:hypothetical protein